MEKLHDSKNLPKIVEPKDSAKKRCKGSKMVVLSPMDVDDIMAKASKRRLITIDEIKNKISGKYKTDICYLLTSGIFAWIAAYAAEEKRAKGKKKITPWWRTLKSGYLVNEVVA